MTATMFVAYHVFDLARPGIATPRTSHLGPIAFRVPHASPHRLSHTPPRTHTLPLTVARAVPHRRPSSSPPSLTLPLTAAHASSCLHQHFPTSSLTPSPTFPHASPLIAYGSSHRHSRFPPPSLTLPPTVAHASPHRRSRFPPPSLTLPPTSPTLPLSSSSLSPGNEPPRRPPFSPTSLHVVISPLPITFHLFITIASPPTPPTLSSVPIVSSAGDGVVTRSRWDVTGCISSTHRSLSCTNPARMAGAAAALEQSAGRTAGAARASSSPPFSVVKAPLQVDGVTWHVTWEWVGYPHVIRRVIPSLHHQMSALSPPRSSACIQHFSCTAVCPCLFGASGFSFLPRHMYSAVHASPHRHPRFLPPSPTLPPTVAHASPHRRPRFPPPPPSHTLPPTATVAHASPHRHRRPRFPPQSPSPTLPPAATVAHASPHRHRRPRFPPPPPSPTLPPTATVAHHQWPAAPFHPPPTHFHRRIRPPRPSLTVHHLSPTTALCAGPSPALLTLVYPSTAGSRSLLPVT
ncbi:unnamed protein product [Closterium sp. NIES-64]|nr:unnamed protein product [Closterium sp. NIES-64]